MINTAKLADAEQQAEIATLQRDLAIAKNQLESLTSKCDRLQDDNEDLSQKLLKRAKRDGESTVLMERLNSMRAQLRDMERSRDQAAADAAELRAVMQQYVDQIQTIDAAPDPEEHEALRQELEMVREQARRDLQDLQDQLEEQVNQVQSVDSDNAIETEALRQEHEVLAQSLSDRSNELQNSQHTCQLLEDELEDAHAAIDEMRRQLEQQAEELKQLAAAEEARTDSVEEILAENIDDEDDYEQSVPVLDIKTTNSGFLSKRSLLSIIVGGLIAFTVLEVMNFSAGKGELLQMIMTKQAAAPVPVVQPVQEIEEKVIIPDHSSEESLSGQIRRD